MKTKKKFDLFSIIVAVITLTTLAIGALVFGNFVSDMGTDFQEEANDMASYGFISQENANISTDFIANDINKYNDSYVFWFFIAIFVSLMLVGLFLEFEPSIMIIIFIFGSIAVLGAWIGSELYYEFSTDSVLETTAGEMTKTQILMGNPYFSIFIFLALIVMLIIMYSKKRQGEYQ